MSALGPPRMRRRVILCALFLLLLGPAAAETPPDQTPDSHVARAIEIWREGTDEAKLRALYRFSRRGELAAPAVSLLLPAMTDNDVRVRARVAEVLGDIGPLAERAVPALTAALEDVDDGVCESAVCALGEFGTNARAAVPALVRCLRSNVVRRRRSVALTLSRIGAPAVPALADLLKDDDSRMRCAAAGALGQLDCKPVALIPAMIDAARKSTRDDRGAILAALRQFGPEAVAALAIALREGDAFFAFDVGDVLVAVGEAAVPALCRELDDSGVVLRTRVIRILGRIGAPAERAVPRLVRLLENHELRVEAADALARIAPEGRDDTRVLIVALKDGGGASRAHAAAVLGRIGDTQKELAGRVVRYLIPATRDLDSGVRAAAVRSIGKIATLDEDLFGLMCRKLLDPAPEVRAAGLEALGRCGRRSESRAIRTGLLIDPDYRVRVEAVESMHDDDMNSGPVVTRLFEILGDVNATARAAAAAKLEEYRAWMRPLGRSDAKLSNDVAYKTLCTHLDDSEPRVRAAAARLLPYFESRKADSIPALSTCLKDEAVMVRIAAVKAIAYLGSAANEIAPALLDRLTDTGKGAPDGVSVDGVSVSILAARALEMLGGEVKAELMRRLIGMLGSTNENGRQQGFLALRELADEAVGPLMKALCDPKEPRTIKVAILDVFTAHDGPPQEVREYSGGLIRELRESLPCLESMMQDDDPVVRRRVFRLIALIDPGRDVVVKSFMAAARVQDPAEMHDLAGFLKACDMRALVEGLADPDPDVRTSIVNALTNLVAQLRQQLGEPDVSTSADAHTTDAIERGEADGLRPKIFARLVSALDDPDSQVRWAAIRAFESLGTNYDAKLRERLIAIARDTTTRARRGATIYRQDRTGNTDGCARKAVDERLRLAAIDCLAADEMHAEAVMPVLIDAIADGDPLTRLHAMSALGRMDEPAKASAPALIELLRSMRASEENAKLATVEADGLTVATKLAALALLGELRRESSPAIPELIDLLFDPVLEVRAKSAAVLGQIGRDAVVCVPALVKQIGRGRLEVSTGREFVSAVGVRGQAALIEVIGNVNLPDEDRRGAAELLGAMGREAELAIPELERALKTAGPGLRGVIEEAIRVIGEGNDGRGVAEGILGLRLSTDRLSG
jgi:HEAT repeat protein